MMQLSELLDRPVRLFSILGACDRRSAGAVRNAGASGACTAAPGAVGPSSDPYRLPRMHVGDWPADELIERISERTSERLSPRA